MRTESRLCYMMLHQILAVFFVLGLVLFLTVFLSKHGWARGSFMGAKGLRVLEGRRQKRIRILERVPLTPQHALHLISIDSRVMVLATSPSTCMEIAECPAETGPQKPGVDSMVSNSDL